MTTKIDLDDLERKARNASAGWVSDKFMSDFVSRYDAEHVAANSPQVTLALIARIRRLEHERGDLAAPLSLLLAAERTVAIADEAFGIAPVESIDETLTRIERGIEAQRARIRELENESTVIPTFAIQDIVCSSCGHQHGGASVGRICIGCPCEERPGQ